MTTAAQDLELISEAAREAGLALWFTMDAGPNVKLLFEAQDEARVREVFPGVEVVAPFG